MSALVYILKRTLANTIRGLIRKPGALIAYIIIGLLFLTSAIFSSFSDNSSKSLMNPNTVKAIITGYTAFLFFIAVSSSLSGSSFFRMADVNLLFTAPLKAGNILIYGFIKQLAVNFLVMAYLALQYPNWKVLFGFRDGVGWILAVSYVLIVMVTSLAGMLLYSFVSKKPGRRDKAKTAIYLSLAVFLLPIAVNTLKTGDLLQSTAEYFSNDSLRFIPLLGWFREMLLGAVNGFTTSVILALLLTLATTAITLILLYRMDTDFYEDVLAGTELKENALRSMREGKTAATVSNRNYRKVKFRFTMEGSKAIFQKQLLEKRKTGIWFISARTLILLAGSLVAAFSVKAGSETILSGILVVASYMIMIFTMIGSWEGELSRHYIYLIPGSPFEKVIYATLPEVIKVLVEAAVVLGITGFILRAPLVVVLAGIAAYTGIGSVFTYSDLLVRRAFGKIHGRILRIFFRIFLMFVIIIVVAVPASVIIATTGNYGAGLFAAALLCMLMSLIFILTGIGLFKKPEFQ
jgi:hypothetical protein